MLDRKILLFVLLGIFYLVATWHIDLIVLNFKPAAHIISSCGNNITYTIQSITTNGFFTFSAIQTYHIALYTQMIAVLGMFLVGLDLIIKEKGK